MTLIPIRSATMRPIAADMLINQQTLGMGGACRMERPFFALIKLHQQWFGINACCGGYDGDPVQRVERWYGNSATCCAFPYYGVNHMNATE